MASPQKENGYTPIANEIVEALARTRINGEAMQVLWVIIRKTYGFNKKEDAISLSQFVDISGLPKPAVCKALRKLKYMGIIGQKNNAVANKYEFIKNYSLWKPLAKKITLAKKPKRVTQKDNNRWPKSHIQKTITKDTLTKDIASPGDAALIISLIDSFKEVNPTEAGGWYKNTTQRSAAARLIVEYGFDRVAKAIKVLPRTNVMPFFPSITTLDQLSKKWTQLESAFEKRKNEQLTKGRGLA